MGDAEEEEEYFEPDMDENMENHHEEELTTMAEKVQFIMRDKREGF